MSMATTTQSVTSGGVNPLAAGANVPGWAVAAAIATALVVVLVVAVKN